jgi:carbonic anhydrase
MEEKKEIAIVGAVYDVASGRVDFTVVPHGHQATGSPVSGQR